MAHALAVRVKVVPGSHFGGAGEIFPVALDWVAANVDAFWAYEAEEASGCAFVVVKGKFWIPTPEIEDLRSNSIILFRTLDLAWSAEETYWLEASSSPYLSDWNIIEKV